MLGTRARARGLGHGDPGRGARGQQSRTDREEASIARSPKASERKTTTPARSRAAKPAAGAKAKPPARAAKAGAKAAAKPAAKAPKPAAKAAKPAARTARPALAPRAKAPAPAKAARAPAAAKPKAAPPPATAPAPPRPRRARPPRKVEPDKLERLVIAARKSLEDDKAEDIVVLDVTGRADYADRLIVATGLVERQLQAMATHLDEALAKEGVSLRRDNIQSSPDWVLIDAGDLVIHLFRPETRALYAIEKMWGPGSPEREGLTVEPGHG
ncbi:MAG TPA: ribosome silencing factor [Acetobacteraceae bacterium]|nr:ribosome silencing factor [Acetobacteraceae bacterium]